ncbi:MAG: M1 family aminopeptidase [Candidatus Eiseniibacteriota bacterium]|jgi:aminopeptidase N
MPDRHRRLRLAPLATRIARSRRHARPLPWVTLCALLAIAAGCLGSLAFAGLDEAPPVPSAADREAFLYAHRARLGAERVAPAARAVHDEYDVDHYDVALTYDIPGTVLYGEVAMTATAAIADLAEVTLDFFDPMVVDALTVNGGPATYEHADPRLIVTLDGVYQPGEQFTITVTYHGLPYYPGAPFRFSNHNGIPMVLTYSEPYGAPAWWPCKDDPKDKATFSIHVTAPDTLVTVSNGVLDSVVDNGNGTATYNWVHDYPMPTYLFSLATTDFESWTEIYTALDGITTMPVDYFAYPEDFADAQISWQDNIQMMEYYRTIFGEYPFLEEKYAIAEFQHPGAMEHQTCTSMGFGFITGTPQYDFVVAHELSHSWVGDMITMTEWSHAWCKEGFATLCEALYYESLYGSSYYHNYMNGLGVMGYAHLQLYGINPPLHAAIYYKGAWVLHMLRHVLGDGPFFDGVFAYTNEPAYRYGSADTDDMRLKFEEASARDLTWFFDQWIYSPGFPIYNQLWESAPSGGGGYDVTLYLNQTQTTGPIFKMPVDVRILTSLGAENFTVWDSLASQAFEFHVDGQPTLVSLDPEAWLIKQVTYSTDALALTPTPPEAFAAAHPNPFNPRTTIRYGVPVRGPATLRIYDAGGRLVRELVDGMVDAGSHEVVWDGLGARGRRLPSGVYFHRLESGPWRADGRLVLVR